MEKEQTAKQNRPTINPVVAVDRSKLSYDELTVIIKDELENGYLLPNGERVKEGDKIRAIEEHESVYEVYHNGAYYCFRTHPYTGDFPANYKLEHYKNRVELIK